MGSSVNLGWEARERAAALLALFDREVTEESAWLACKALGLMWPGAGDIAAIGAQRSKLIDPEGDGR